MKKLAAVKVYWIASFAWGLITSIMFTLDMVYFVTIVKLNPLQLVLVGTTLESMVFLFEIPTGIVADVYSRRLSTIIGYVLMGLGFLIEGSLPVFVTILLAQVVWGLGWTFISGAQSAWIADEVGAENVGPIYLRGTQGEQLGGLLGIPMAVVLGSVRLNLPILTGGALFILLALFLAVCMPEQGFHPVAQSERKTWRAMTQTLREGVGLIRTRPALLTFLAIAVFVGLSSEGYDRLWTAHILQSFRFPAVGHLRTETWFGILRAGSMLLTMAATEITRRCLNERRAAAMGRLLQAIFAMMGASILLLALTGNIILAMLAYWVFETLRCTAYPLSEAWVNQQIDSTVRATVLSMTSQVDALGQIVGGPIVGTIGTLFSLRAALVAAGVILAPVVALYGRVVAQWRKPQPT